MLKFAMPRQGKLVTAENPPQAAPLDELEQSLTSTRDSEKQLLFGLRRRAKPAQKSFAPRQHVSAEYIYRGQSVCVHGVIPVVYHFYGPPGGGGGLANSEISSILKITSPTPHPPPPR